MPKRKTTIKNIDNNESNKDVDSNKHHNIKEDYIQDELNSFTKISSNKRRKPVRQNRNHLLNFDSDISSQEDESFDNKQDNLYNKDNNSYVINDKSENIHNEYEKLQASYLHIENEMLMQYILFFIVGLYLFYYGIKYNHRTFLYIGIVLVLYTSTNTFMFFY